MVFSIQLHFVSTLKKTIHTSQVSTFKTTKRFFLSTPKLPSLLTFLRNSGSNMTNSIPRMAMIQLKVGSNKEANLNRAKMMVQEAVKQGHADIIVLPECFSCPYGTGYFDQYAEDGKTGPSTQLLQTLAKSHNVYIFGGSIPERDEKGDLYNTCYVYDPKGQQIGKHRKLHLFDINIPGKIAFKESEVLKAGNKITIIETMYGKIGLAICYDIRFPELAMIAARKGCIAMFYPGAFNTTTGPLHWELLQRARALDNQMYVATCSPARNPDSKYQAWGHSSIVDPMGEVIATTEHEETIIYGNLDIEKLNSTRSNIPVYSQRRFDIYPDVAK